MDAASVGVLARVGQQVQQHLPQPLLVRDDLVAYVVVDREGQRNLLGVPRTATKKNRVKLNIAKPVWKGKNKIRVAWE